MENPGEQQNLLIDFEDTYVRASHGKRLANYIIDILAFYLLLIVIGVLLALISPESVDELASLSDNQFADRLTGLLLYILFMFAQEAIFKGRSMGKFITGTRAVNLDGSTITVQKAMLRALCRAVPFSVFSALGSPCNPWQDSWTNTMVIDQKRSVDPAL